jgi:hypothetical protein
MAYASKREKAVLGKKGEELSHQLLRQWQRTYGYTDIQDVSKVKAFRDIDCDFQVVKKDGTKVLIEVKTEEAIAETGNIYVETVTNCDTGLAGWYYKSKADKLFYIDWPNQILYVFDFDDFRQEVELIKHRLRLVRAWSQEEDGWEKETEGYLLNIRDFSKFKSYRKFMIS